MAKLSHITDYTALWHRFVFNNTAIYISTRNADWFIPNPSGDAVLQSGDPGMISHQNPDTRLFLSSLPAIRPGVYKGRSHMLKPDGLRELWFHVTNRCNLSCTHCLFSSSPSDALQLPLENIVSISDDAYQNGCRLFALTGGEPFVHPDSDQIITTLLGRAGSHVVVLTNGMAALPFLERHNPDPAYFHLQISVDGLEENHDRIRSAGSFKKLSVTLKKLKDRGYPFTLSMCVNRDNVHDMPGFVDFAGDMGASNVHFMWYFIRGRGGRDCAPDTDTVFDNLVVAADRARQRGIPIDNLEALRTQIFAPPGTIHDGSTAAWESLAVGPDGALYPSAALVGILELSSDMTDGLISCWMNSPVLQQIRACTIADQTSAFRFLLGGGDMDHSYIHNRTFMGHDPYDALHERLALWLISIESSARHDQDKPGVVLQMGDILESCGAHGGIAFVHSNCLLATSQND
ncbi:MAG: radical SAM protein, partial [Desulfobacteraceae bacterium]|nr:radical SAM protein [Desulfobacteraceae bacterium]